MMRELLWADGMLLGPQHFQQQQRWIHEGLHALSQRGLQQSWGIERLKWDEGLLRQGVLQLQAFSLFFQDGTSVNSDHGAPIPTARVIHELSLPSDRTTVYLCLPNWRQGANCLLSDESSADDVRYVIKQLDVADQFSNALPTVLQAVLPKVLLRLDNEPRDGTLGIPVAVLRRDASGHWQFDDSYLPPVTTVHAAPRLVSSILGLREVLLAKSVSLSKIHRQRNEVAFEHSSRDLASFWLHHTVNLHYPLVRQLTDDPLTSPQSAYRVLSQLAASLMVFSASHQLSDLPVFQIERLTEVFDELLSVIRHLLDTVISSRFIPVPLQQVKPTLLTGALGIDWALDRLDMYLAIRTDTPVEEWLSAVPLRIKVGNPDDVDRIVHTALPGIRLVHSPVVPSSLPIRIGQVYFALDRQDELYQRMAMQRSVAIFVPETMQSFEFDLIAVYR